jgi:hypothetical protein
MHAARIFRYSSWDGLLVLMALGHGMALLLWPSVLVVGLGMWWCANTVSHNFIHLPFFRARGANAGFSIYLTLLLGVPQTLWRQRHLAHHADSDWRFHATLQLAVEASAILALWCALALVAPKFLMSTYAPGLLLGLLLCHFQGHYEHARGTTSHYGWLYNLLFFNDGYHAEHHQKPARHWRELRQQHTQGRVSRWPAVLRWLEMVNLETLERVVLRSKLLQRFILAAHRGAFQRLLRSVPDARQIAVVGGALFPRTALLLKQIAPSAAVTVIDSNESHIAIAHTFLNGSVRYEHRMFESAHPTDKYDVVVIPLSYVGDRERLYREPPARALLVQDWLWRPRGSATSTISWLLLKRLNLVLR